jgi:hypothetical protein
MKIFQISSLRVAQFRNQGTYNDNYDKRLLSVPSAAAEPGPPQV